MTVDTKELVCTIAYLIGVKKHIIINCFEQECPDVIERLLADNNAMIIRYLSKIRTTLFLKFKHTDDEMRYNLKNLNTIEPYDHENIKKLEKAGISLIKPNYRSELYMLDITRLIIEHIDGCSHLFPGWINWAYIRDLFSVPKYTKPGVMKQEFEKFISNILYYPFQMYIHWKPADYGSILYNDGKFLNILYQQHNDTFDDFSKHKDAHSETKNNIYDFINSGNRIAIAVDCENSDVFKLYGVLKNLKSQELQKIDKIVLYDDCHTTSGWDWLEPFSSIPVEHIEVERVQNHKSLVDIKMTAGVCKDFYENCIDSFILFSSDSDFWGLITSLPKASFLVMYEYSKCGQAIKDALSENDIYYCSIDDFYTGNIDDLKRAVLFSELEKYFPRITEFNGLELARLVHENTRITASEKEIEIFYNKYIRTLRLACDYDGNFKIVIAS